MHELVHGPPMISGVPGGHWISIVGPTLGDAVTSCVLGPSGLRKWDPGIRVLNGTGGTIVRWSNGVEAKVFGAQSPEDVERFRAGGNRTFCWCTPADTLILTETGERPIATLAAGERVWTDKGLRPITNIVMTDRASRILELTLANGRTLRCSPGHRIYLEGGKSYREARDIRVGDIVEAWSPSHTTDTSTSQSQEPATTPVRTEWRCTEPSTSEKSGQSPTDMRSTTLTAIPSTTQPATSSPSRLPSTQPSTLEIVRLGARGDVRLSSVSIAATPSPGGGSASSLHASARSGVAMSPAPLGVSGGVGTGTPAPSAASRPGTRTTAPGSATTSHAHQSESVSCVEQPSIDTSGTAVVSIAEAPTLEPVYQLTVEGRHRYFAESVLSRNCEEFAAWRYMEEAWQQIRYGLRSGLWPHCLITTTPKPKKIIKEIWESAAKSAKEGEQNPEYVLTQGSTDDNPHLDDRVKRMLYADYENTRLGRQELLGELLLDVENALWLSSFIDDHRISLNDCPNNMDRVIVAVDPQAEESGAETGIVVGGAQREFKRDGSSAVHGYVLGDETVQGTPDIWAKAAIRAYYDYEADFIVAEINHGGDMVKHALNSVDEKVPVMVVRASRGKAARAEPVALQYERGRVHHVGFFPELEDQMLTFDPLEPPEKSPDRLDAMVWLISTLLVGYQDVSQTIARDHRLRGRR